MHVILTTILGIDFIFSLLLKIKKMTHRMVKYLANVTQPVNERADFEAL